MQSIDLRNNRLKDLDLDSFNGITFLEHLSLQDNRLTALSPNIFATLPRLKEINLSQNNLEEIDRDLFSENTNLLYINLRENNIKYIHHNAFNDLELKFLDLTRNQLKTLFVPSVENLYAANNSIRSLEINGPYSGIDSLELQNNQIEDILLVPSIINDINLSNNKISSLDFLDNANVTSLDISANHLNKIYNFNIQIKKFLNLSSNNLENLDFFNETEEDFLEEIDLSNNKISLFSMEFLNLFKNLKSLDLSGNKLEFIDLESDFNFPEYFQYINLYMNPWRCNQLKEILDLLRENHIKYSDVHKHVNIHGCHFDIDGIPCFNVSLAVDNGIIKNIN